MGCCCCCCCPNRGVQTNNWTRPAFDALSVKNIKSEQKIYTSSQHVKHIFVSVDPAAGGNKSKYAILSCIYVDGHKMVVSTIIFLFFFLYDDHLRFHYIVFQFLLKIHHHQF